MGVTTLPFDFDIFLRSGSRTQPGDGGVGPRQRPVLEVGADDRREQPGADDLVGLGTKVHGEPAAEEVGVVDPPGGDLGVSDDVAHVSMTSGSPMKPPGWPRWSAV